MSLRDTFLNMLGAGNEEARIKQKNTVFKDARDFLRNGNRDRLTPTWSDIQMSDRDMYRGYSYAVIQKRSNKVATLAKNNLKTWANPDIVDEFQKKDEDVIHPYLKLIADSTDFTEKQFWKSISIYMDLAGRYYLGVIRNRIQPLNPNLPAITTDPTKFIMLNPYEIRRVVDKNGIVAGYIERKKDGRYREWPLHQIIEMRELNPFDPENSQWAMTDAAKNAVYTINQSGDYTRQSLNGNIDAPGIITTDVLLNDEDFANFRARITQHVKGEPLFGNGTGAINWNAMQIDLDKAALMDINEINRTELFAVSGTSKTSLGIEQSGTTRETARVQSEQFISDTAQPRLEDIVDFLNLDYKKYYTREYKTTGYYIEVESAVGRDYDTEQKATELKTSQFGLAMQLIQSGYTEQSAYQFAEGKIDFEDLELEKGLDKPKNSESPEEGEASTENSPNSPKNGPRSGSGSGDDNDATSEQNSLETADNEVLGDSISTADLNELTPHSELVEKMEGEKSLPLHNHEGCTCDHDHKLEHFINEVQPEEGKEVREKYNEFIDEIREIEKETVDACARKVNVNAFEISDIIGERKRKTLTEKIKNALHKYWWVIFPLFANNSMARRNEEFEEDIQFIFNNDLQAGVDDNAERVAKGHMETILNDVLEASNSAYNEVLEEAAAEIIIEVYDNSPTRWEKYFEHKPTMAEALSSIRRTDILEVNRKIYEKANKMAFEGYNRRDIVKAIRAKYKDISEKRATLIARNETARAYGRSQFEADKQFLNGTGKMAQAYKVWYSSRPANEQDKICPFCKALIDQTNANPIPFNEPFLKYGDSIEVIENGKVKIFTANYEDIEGSTLHPNCLCRYRLVFKNSDGEFIKTLNGGKGSGNFGHAGRPGEIGGSAPQGSVSESRRTVIGIGDLVEGKDSDGNWHTGSISGFPKNKTTTVTYKQWDNTEKEMTVSVMEITDEQGKVHEIPMWGPNVKKIRRADAPTESPAERRTKAQREALDEVFKMINCNNPTYFYNNMAEHSAVALRDELSKAKEYGIDLSEFTLGKFNGTRANARVIWEKFSSRTGSAKLQLELSTRFVADGEGFAAKQKTYYEKNWHTADDIAGIIRHELGHIRAYQIAKDSGLDMWNEKGDWGRGRFDNWRYEFVCRKIISQAIGKAGYTKSTESKKGDISEYGETNVKEAVAEAFSNPDFSDFTRKVADVMLDKNLKLSLNNLSEKTINQAKNETPENSLCSGYPMSKEDWEILQGIRKEPESEYLTLMEK